MDDLDRNSLGSDIPRIDMVDGYTIQAYEEKYYQCSRRKLNIRLIVHEHGFLQIPIHDEKPHGYNKEPFTEGLFNYYLFTDNQQINGEINYVAQNNHIYLAGYSRFDSEYDLIL